MAGSGKASGRALQRLGRVIRPFPGKKNAVVIDFSDGSKYLKNHTAARIKIYSTEAGFKLKFHDKSMDVADTGVIPAPAVIKKKRKAKKDEGGTW